MGHSRRKKEWKKRIGHLKNTSNEVELEKYEDRSKM